MNKHRGSSFDTFLEEEGILEEVTARVQLSIDAIEKQSADRGNNWRKTANNTQNSSHNKHNPVTVQKSLHDTLD